MNRNRIVSRLGLIAASSLLCFAIACGGSSLEGTYRNANGLATLELRSGGAASFTIMGESHTCTYQKADGKLLLTCPNQDVLRITLHEDGSMTPEETFIGTLTKSKA